MSWKALLSLPVSIPTHWYFYSFSTSKNTVCLLIFVLLLRYYHYYQMRIGISAIGTLSD